MPDINEHEDFGVTALFAITVGVLLFALFSGTSWAATLLGAWTASF
jgi:hypothetical protein